MTPLLEVQNLHQYFKLGRRTIVKAVDNVSFSIDQGEFFSLVGESGSGKSSVARCVMGIYPAAEGSIRWKGRELLGENKRNDVKIQMIFQDTAASLDPRMTAEQIVMEPMEISRCPSSKAERREKAAELFEQVHLDSFLKTRYMAELSGGQRQRLAIARALAMEPALILADEPIASLDVSIQAQIVNLFRDIQQRLGIAFLFIAHDLALVSKISDRIGVMYRGRLVELGAAKEVAQNPAHPYTRQLFSAIPNPDPAFKREKLMEDGQPISTEGSWIQVNKGHFAIL